MFCPDDTPAVNVREIAMQGAEVFLVDGLIDDCGKLVAEGEKTVGWFNCSTLREPYRIEGKKTMGFELAEQLGWELPDVIFYPTGGGTGIIGMWKAFAEMEALGWIGRKRPRMVVVQAAGCAPMVKAWEDGVEHAPRWQDAHTFAAGIRVPQAVGDFLILRAVREVRRLCDRGRRRRDHAGLARGRRRGGPPPLPRGRGDLRGLQGGRRGRPGQTGRARHSVQLRHRPQIPHARGRNTPEARRPRRLGTHAARLDQSHKRRPAFAGTPAVGAGTERSGAPFPGDLSRTFRPSRCRKPHPAGT